MHHIIDKAILFICLVLAQVLICNHILIFSMATPLVLIYFIIRMRVGLPATQAMTLAFLLGLCVDIFSDTLGMNSLCCTILSVIRKPVLLAYVPRDDSLDDITPSISSLGIWTYGKYMFTMTLIYALLLFGIEYFSISAIWEMLQVALSSTLLTAIILLGIDSLMTNRHEKRL